VNSKHDGGEGLNVKPYKPQPGSEKTSPHDSSPVGSRAQAASERKSKVA
jgi:Mn-containing catalase